MLCDLCLVRFSTSGEFTVHGSRVDTDCHRHLIYCFALWGLGDDAKFGAAGLIMAILGGSVMPPLQAYIIDMHTVFGMPSTNVSFILPFICFVVIAIYGFRTKLRSIGKLLG